MVKVNIIKWAQDVWHSQTWFGYTYIKFWVNGEDMRGGWYKNDSPFIKALSEMEQDLEERDKN